MRPGSGETPQNFVLRHSVRREVWQAICITECVRQFNHEKTERHHGFGKEVSRQQEGRNFKQDRQQEGGDQQSSYQQSRGGASGDRESDKARVLN
jgi:hypothetical protein